MSLCVCSSVFSFCMLVFSDLLVFIGIFRMIVVVCGRFFVIVEVLLMSSIVCVVGDFCYCGIMRNCIMGVFGKKSVDGLGMRFGLFVGGVRSF